MTFLRIRNKCFWLIYLNILSGCPVSVNVLKGMSRNVKAVGMKKLDDGYEDSCS